jgi:rhamnosyltransferase subunit B
LTHRKLWHPVDGLGVMWRGLIKHTLIPVYERLAAAVAASPCVVVASPVSLGARAAQHKLGVPLVTAYTAATMLRSCSDPMTMAHWKVPRWMPQFARRAAWRALDRHKLEPMARPALAALFAHAGIDAPKASIFGEWMHSPLAGVTLFPDWFARAANDWPKQVVQAGFPLFDGDRSGAPDERLLRFLDAGPAPVVFMPGTAARDAGGFFQAARRACTRLGLRGLLLGEPAGPAIGDREGKNLFGAPYAPFGWLLPRASALVHHGGIGSLAQALRAGLPQLLVPRGFDQFDNTLRLHLLGVGDSIARGDRKLETLTRKLGGILEDTALRERCRQLSPRLDPGAALDRVCDVVERVA